MIHRLEKGQRPMKTNRTVVLTVSLCLVMLWFIAPSASAFVHEVTAGGTPFFWDLTDIGDSHIDGSGRVIFWLNSSGSADIGDGSDLNAVRDSLDEWSNVAASEFEYIDGGTTATSSFNGSDGQNTFFWAESGSIPNQQLGVTSITFNPTTGEIIDTDIRLNGEDFTWVTDGNPGSGEADVACVATHELGHAAGLDHVPSLGSTMYPYGGIGDSTLSPDDIAGISTIYPSVSNNFGAISGTITLGASGAFGAHIVALDSTGAVHSTAISDTDGTYTIEGLDAGSYTVYVEPMDGPMTEANLGGYYSSLDATFNTLFYDGASGSYDPSSATTVSVSASTTTTGINFTVSGTPAINVELIGLTATSGSASGGVTRVLVLPASSNWLTVAGSGVSASTPISITGSGVTIGTSSRWTGSFPPPFVAGLDAAVQIGASDGPRSVLVRGASETAMLTGGFEIEPSPASISGVNPVSGPQGATTLSVAITGSSTNFVNGVSVASFSGTGISVVSTTVSSPTSATASINIASGVAVGARDVTVTTGTEVATGTGLFTVLLDTDGDGDPDVTDLDDDDDGLSDVDEDTLGTDPLDPDSDDDLVDDGADDFPLDPDEQTDADADGLGDKFESVIIDFDEFDAYETLEDVLPGDDFDDDGESNAAEFQNGTDPTDPESSVPVSTVVGMGILVVAGLALILKRLPRTLGNHG